jgi:hypothetical protein
VDAEYDNFADAVALVTAVRAGDSEGASAVLMNADWRAVATVLARLCAEILNEQNVADAYWRAWAEQAVRRA